MPLQSLKMLYKKDFVIKKNRRIIKTGKSSMVNLYFSIGRSSISSIKQSSSISTKFKKKKKSPVKVKVKSSMTSVRSSLTLKPQFRVTLFNNFQVTDNMGVKDFEKIRTDAIKNTDHERFSLFHNDFKDLKYSCYNI